MSVTGTFNLLSAVRTFARRKAKAAPFSLRLTEAERERLIDAAAGAPLGAYIKARLFGSALPVRMRRTGLAIADRKALAELLALLGRSRLASNLNQLAHAAHIGTLPATVATETALADALRAVRDMRDLLLTGLGLKADGAS